MKYFSYLLFYLRPLLPLPVTSSLNRFHFNQLGILCLFQSPFPRIWAEFPHSCRVPLTKGRLVSELGPISPLRSLRSYSCRSCRCMYVNVCFYEWPWLVMAIVIPSSFGHYCFFTQHQLSTVSLYAFGLSVLAPSLSYLLVLLGNLHRHSLQYGYFFLALATFYLFGGKPYNWTLPISVGSLHRMLTDGLSPTCLEEDLDIHVG